MIVCFSFDDGRCDFYRSSLIMQEHKLKGTFHITTGFVDGTYLTDDFGIGMMPLTISQIKEMNDIGMEISSHGDKHRTNSFDFRTSREKIFNWIGKEKIGFSVPNSNATKEDVDKLFAENGNHLLYVRVGRNQKCYSFLSKISYFCYHHLFKSQLFYNSFNKHNLMFELDKTRLYSSVITRDIKPKNIKKFIEKYMNSECTLILMFHSVVEKPSNKWEWSLENFKELCRFISELTKEGKIQCKKIDEL